MEPKKKTPVIAECDEVLHFFMIALYSNADIVLGIQRGRMGT